jgi:hypothetical protein
MSEEATGRLFRIAYQSSNDPVVLALLAITNELAKISAALNEINDKTPWEKTTWQARR